MDSSERRERIRQAVSITEVVGEYLPLLRCGARFKALCPFHDDHSPSLEIDPEARRFHCCVCATSGDVVDFLRMYEELTIDQVLTRLKGGRGPGDGNGLP